MANRKILTLDDLYDYYSDHIRSTHFSSRNSEKPIIVQTKGKINFENEVNSECLTAVRLQACHTERNLNKSSISKEVMEEKIIPSFANKPILGYIHEVDGQLEFYDHRMHKDEDTNEDVYDEKPVGIIPETNNAELEYDEKNDRYNVMIDGYLFNDYSKSVEIIEREEECDVSIELCIYEMSYRANDKTLIIEDGEINGVTILGKTPYGEEVKPGMAGSNIKLKDFKQNNSLVGDYSEENNKLIELLERLNTTLSDFNINKDDESNCHSVEKHSEKGGNSKMDKFNELIAKYNVNEEDITFEYENLSDEELESKFEEVFGEKDSEDSKIKDNESKEEDKSDDEEKKDNDEEDDKKEEEACGGEKKKKKCSVEVDGVKYEYELSLSEKIGALNDLVNIAYSESDNCYYSVDVYEKYLVMKDWWNGKAFKQSYAEEDGEFSLKGDRVEVFATYVTQEEMDALDEMKSNYSSISDELSKYKDAEVKAEKDSILADASYEEFKDSEHFKEIIDNVDTYSVNDLKIACDLAFAKCVKENGKFSSDKSNNKKQFSFVGLSSRNNEEGANDFLDGLLKLNKK